ncbi:hypothetical protein PHBOTO_003558 [Pseudozyma hubeiensis]|nr:hypothetical protein PHBOTO_003558 [Pseudozyma hubeiensis]
MASCTQAIPRKRAPSDTFRPSTTNAKYTRIASTCPPPIPGATRNDTTDPSVKFDPSESQRTSPSASSSAHTPDSTLPNSPDPFPRYSLGIPHLDVLLPFRDGLDLLHAYHQGIGWIYTPVDRTTLLETLEEAERHGADSIHPHRLACLLAALALGDLFSHCFPASSPSPSPSSSSAASPADVQLKRGRIWFGVASACLAGCRNNAELMQNPTPDACSALYLMSTYLLCSNDEQLFHRSQGLTSLALILAKSAVLPSCAVSAQAQSPSSSAAPSVASQHQAATDLVNSAASSPSQSSSTSTATVTCQDRLNCNRLLTDLIFHLRCQTLTFALPCTLGQSPSRHYGVSPASLVDVPAVQAIWTALGTPLYACLDAFGSRYSPNIFHNWKLGLADLMHQVTLTSQPESLQSRRPNADGEPKQRPCRSNMPLPDHQHVVKLDERIRRYHASLPDFLLLHKPLPFEMAGKVDEDELAQIICQRHMACSMVHRMLMALHRPWFLSALTGRSTASLSQPNGAQQVPASTHSDGEVDTTEVSTSSSAIFSLSAVLRSATWQTETYASATACAPPQALAWWQLTNNALAAAIVQATALLRLSSPSSSTVEPEKTKCSTSRFHAQVRTDLDKNICSFQKVAKRCKLAAKALPFLQRVRSAIDSGICRSRHACNAERDTLQTSTTTSKVCEPASTPLSSPSLSTSITDNTAPTIVSDSLNCNNTRIVTSNSIDSSISNSNLTTSNSNPSNSNNDNTTTNNSDTSSSSSSSSSNAYSSQVTSATSMDGQNVSRPEAPHIPDANKAAACVDKQTRPTTEGRRGSSAKSELETIFGPIASGLELTDVSAPPATVKPLYRQSWEPIPVPSSVVHEGDERNTQAPSSDDTADSSASSSSCPRTPKSTTPRLGATNSIRDDSTTVFEHEAAAADRKKTSDAPSDLVLDCIRFWQPDMLAPAP